MKVLKIKDFLNDKKIIPNNIKFYEIAITHSTYSNENKNTESYEMLE